MEESEAVWGRARQVGEEQGRLGESVEIWANYWARDSVKSVTFTTSPPTPIYLL
jgi:hypothetical protein